MRVVKSGKLKGENARFVGKLKVIGFRYVFGQRVQALSSGGVESHRSIQYLEIGNDHGWQMRIIVDAVRIKSIETVDAAKIHAAIPALAESPKIKLVALQTISDVKVSECSCFYVAQRMVQDQFGQSFIGAYPKIA